MLIVDVLYPSYVFVVMFALASVPGVKNGDTIGKLLLLPISLLVEGDVNRWFDFDGVANNLLADLDLGN